MSIITAVYNGNETIETTIRSVLAQKYPNFEYLIIDGGSTDGTVETLKRYDDAIDYWISEPDKGVYDALNKGIDLARGEWIYFLGADDTLADENVLSHFFPHPYGSRMLYGNVIRGTPPEIYGGKFSKVKITCYNICQQAIFYHRELFERFGKFDMKYPILADYVFNMRVFASKITKPRFVDRVVALYSGKGISAKNEDKVFFKERNALIRDLFGLWHLIYSKIDWYLRYRFRDHIVWILRSVPKALVTGKMHLGTCPVCRLKTVFIEQTDKDSVCVICMSMLNSKESRGEK